MERVLYFSGYRMTVFDWEGKNHLGSRSFEPDEEGFKHFEKLLAACVAQPIRLLVDMIEEDFRREVIPHVNIFDRQAVIKRLMDRHYREEDFVYAQLIGRTTVGRRDDQVLLSALTNTGLLEPWLNKIADYNIKLAGIWSLPLLTEPLQRPILNRDDHALIVSRQVRSALRISYLQKGKLMLSRQAKFDKDMWDNDTFDGVILNLERGTDEIYNFLMNQRVMIPGDRLTVYCILNREQLTEARQMTHERPDVHYEFIGIEDLFEHFGLQGCENAKADTLFSYFCTRKTTFQDHYGTEEQKAPFYRYLADRVLKQVTEIGSLVCITAAVFFALKALELDLQQNNYRLDTVELAEEHNTRFAEISAQLDTATYVEQSVQLVDKLTKDAEQAPHQYFGSLSTVFGQQQFAPLNLLQLEWEKRPLTEVAAIVEEHKRRLETKVDVEDPYAYVYEEEEIFDENAPTQQPILTLRGSLGNTNLDYRAVQDLMNNLVVELEALDGIASVILVRTAADLRSSAQFTDQIGEELDKSKADAHVFEILLVIEPVAHA